MGSCCPQKGLEMLLCGRKVCQVRSQNFPQQLMESHNCTLQVMNRPVAVCLKMSAERFMKHFKWKKVKNVAPNQKMAVFIPSKTAKSDFLKSPNQKNAVFILRNHTNNNCCLASVV